MAHDTAKLLLHPRTGDRLVVLEEATDPLGESFRFEILTDVVASPPDDHVHDAQSEHLEVLAGTLNVRIAGRVLVLRAGDAITIAPGTPHAVWNVDPARTRTRGEFHPALDMQQRMEALFREPVASAGR
ncbi:MAG: cupin domain-containing protein [Deltaproteobacteria bacterium]|nr:cupin domain-containing protein [Deltaproteobacteria bacterium]